MASFDPLYGDAEGPLGFPMSSERAKELDELLKKLPSGDGYGYRKQLVPMALDDLKPGERADISWISVEAPDRDRDVVRADGMDDTHFRLNPIVTLNHAYWMPPVGLSLWRKPGQDGNTRGIRAKTYYPSRPESWRSPEWPPDECLSLVQAGLLRGKSIGFLPLKTRPPTDAEVKRDPNLTGVRFIIEKWLLLEYACCYLPVQQHAVVESVSKALGVESSTHSEPEPIILAFEELAGRLRDVDWAAIGRRRAELLRGAV